MIYIEFMEHFFSNKLGDDFHTAFLVLYILMHSKIFDIYQVWFEKIFEMTAELFFGVLKNLEEF